MIFSDEEILDQKGRDDLQCVRIILGEEVDFFRGDLGLHQMMMLTNGLYCCLCSDDPGSKSMANRAFLGVVRAACSLNISESEPSRLIDLIGFWCAGFLPDDLDLDEFHTLSDIVLASKAKEIILSP